MHAWTNVNVMETAIGSAFYDAQERNKVCRIRTLLLLLLIVMILTISALPGIIATVDTAGKTNTGMVTDAFTLTRRALEVRHIDIHAWTNVNVMDTTICPAWIDAQERKRALEVRAWTNVNVMGSTT